MYGVSNIKIITIYDVSNSYFVAVASFGCPETRDKQSASQHKQSVSQHTHASNTDKHRTSL